MQSDLSGPVRVAARVLAGHGVDVRGAERGRGWTNVTWLTDDLVVRVAPRPGPADLLRETRLAVLLPEQVGYPTVLDAGVDDGHEWVLTRRVTGRNLEEVWPELDDVARSGAVEQMWERACHVHRVEVARAARYARRSSPFFPDTPGPAAARLGRLVAAGELTADQGSRLHRVLDRFWAAVPSAPTALNHGDLCAPNTLWQGGQVVGLLDFEFAVVAPTAVDLNEIVKLGFGPGGPAEGTRLRAVVSRIAAAELGAAGGPDVLLGYSVMLEAWLLEQELAAGDGMVEDERARSAELLAAFAEGDGGYFAPVLAGFR